MVSSTNSVPIYRSPFGASLKDLAQGYYPSEELDSGTKYRYELKPGREKDADAITTLIEETTFKCSDSDTPDALILNQDSGISWHKRHYLKRNEQSTY
jgi:hypothetical protein